MADAEPEEVQLIGDLVCAAYAIFCRTLTSRSQVQKGVNASCADDTKGMKGAIIEWITLPDHELVPRLSQRHKFDRGFQHETTGALLCPAGVDWTDSE